MIDTLPPATPPEPVRVEAPWFPTTAWREPTLPPVVEEVDQFDPRCRPDAHGCYVPEECPFSPQACMPARIQIAKRLTPWRRACVIEHEMKHHRRYDHPKGYWQC